MIEIVDGTAVVAAGPADLVVRVGAPAPHPDEATIVLGVADPALASAIATAIATALRAAVERAAEGAPPAHVVLVRSRRRVAERAAELAGAIAIVGVTPRNARHLVAIVDAARAAGAVGVQLVWDGEGRERIEPHVFAALEHARATPSAAPVVLATILDPIASLRLLVTRRQNP